MKTPFTPWTPEQRRADREAHAAGFDAAAGLWAARAVLARAEEAEARRGWRRTTTFLLAEERCRATAVLIRQRAAEANDYV